MELIQGARSTTGPGLRRWRAVSLVMVTLSAIRVEVLLLATGTGAHVSLLAVISFLVLSPLLLLFLLTIRAKAWPGGVQRAIYVLTCATAAYVLLQAPFVIG